MTRHILRATLSSLLMVTCLAAGDLRISVLNGTLGGPGKADRIAVVDLAQGMAEISGVNQVSGSVTISDIPSDAQKQYLIRATLNGVSYSNMFVPDPTLTAWESSVTVFDTEPEMNSVVASVPYFVIYAFEDHIYLQKRYMLDNQSQPPRTFFKSPGIVPVHVPENVTEMDYLTFKNGTMPLKTGPIPVDGGQVLPNALKPGVSEIDIAYTFPYDPTGTLVTENVGFDIGGHFHVYTMPMNLNISAPGLVREGTDQENGLAIWSLENVSKGTQLVFQVSGQGMNESESMQQGEQQQQSSGRILVEHRIDANNELLLSGVLLFIIVIALFFTITQQQTDLREESVTMLKQQKKALLHKYAGLSNDPAAAEEADEVLAQLVSVYKTLERIKA